MPDPRHRLAQGLPGHAAVPTSPDKPAVCPSWVFGQGQDSRELTVPGLSIAQPPSMSHILTAASSQPQGAPVCQPMPMASTRSPQGCQPALPASLSVVMVTRNVVTGEDGASHPSRAVCPEGLAPPLPALPLSPLGLGRGPSVEPLPQAVCWGGSICSAARIAAVSQAAHVGNGDSAILLPPALSGHLPGCAQTDKLISVMTTCLSCQGEALYLQGQPDLSTAAAAGTAEDEEHATPAHLPWAHPRDSCQAGHLSPNISALW